VISEQGGGIEEREERLFDEFLELALGGAAPDPDEFLSARGGGSDELRERLVELRRVGSLPAPLDDGALPFDELGEFRLLERIGRGGMGLVFLAEQRSLERKVALKILRPELAGSSLAAERFKREARAVAKLRHPGIVAVYGFGEDHGVRYLAMEFVPGRTLDDELASGPVPLARKVGWIRDLARALDYAHGEGVIHRDVKPSNVRITPEDRAMLLDFGLVRSIASEGATLTDTFAGSPAYASPEQISSSAHVDARTDVYSLGVTLYRCLTNLPPFEGDSVERVFHAILNAEPVPPRKLDPSIPRDLEIVTLKAFERDPARRYATARELADDLEAVLELRPIRARPPSFVQRVQRTARRNRVAAASVASLAVAMVLFLAWTIFAARGESLRRREEARRTVEEARARIASYRDSRARFASMRQEIQALHHDLVYRHLSQSEYAKLDQRESEIASLERAWEATFYEVLDLLRAAERLDPEVEDAETVRAELYHEKFREAVLAMEDDEADFYRALVLEHDQDGAVGTELRSLCRIDLVSTPPGARVRLFRYLEHGKLRPGGDARMVPVPLGSSTGVPEPGTWCLRVVDAIGELLPGDEIVELDSRPIEGTVLVAHSGGAALPLDRLVAVDGTPIDDGWAVEFVADDAPRVTPGSERDRAFEFERGCERFTLSARRSADLGLVAVMPHVLAGLETRPSLPCRVAREGRLFDSVLPPGANVRPTAAPLSYASSCDIGSTPLSAFEIDNGDYLAVLDLPGYETLRVPFTAFAGLRQFSVELWPAGTTPRDFVRVIQHPDTQGFCAMEREVTCGEYLEFLNDPFTLAEIAASSEAIRIPRQGLGENCTPFWKPDASGRFALPEDWLDSLPVVGISWHDAVAFAAWFDERAASERFDFVLPTFNEFQSAGLAGLRRSFTWGLCFRPKFSRSCFSRPRAGIGPVMEFPIDESALGVYDLCGGAMEWLDT
jgi:hypothetical protein